MNRYDTFLSNYLPKYLQNELIHEIIISDENGNDIKKIQSSSFKDNSKLKLFTNTNILGPFLNKLTACSKSSNEWIVLMDSDNFADTDYFITAKNYIENDIKENEKNIILAPSFAKPNFNYKNMEGIVYNKSNLKKYHYQNTECLMNTGNYVINKYLIDNLNLFNETENIKKSSACDVIYFNTLLFEQLDLNLHIVSRLEYSHVVHDNSIYILTCNNYRDFNNYIHCRYRNL
jgi:hypothetical protein